MDFPRLALVLLALALLANAAAAIYLPGVAPADFERDDLIYIKARHGRRARRGTGR